jgi:diacylglycerol kinase (ATP)
MKLSIIVNPVSGNGRAYKALQHYLDHWNHPEWQAELLTTKSRNHAGLLAMEMLSNPPDLLAVCGGDGTINEVASHVPAPPFPVAILPAGTANVMARELGLPLHPIRALPLALNRSVRRIDLGTLDSGKRRRFLFVTGIGFDAYVVSRIRPQLKANVGMAAFASAIVDCLKSYSFPEFQITTQDNRTFTATSCLAANARSYGGGLLFTPDADTRDGMLDLLILQGRRRLKLARFLFCAWLGKPETGDWIHRLRAREFRIDGPADAFVQADGELAGCLPLEVGLAPSSFPLVVP